MCNKLCDPGRGSCDYIVLPCVVCRFYHADSARRPDCRVYHNPDYNPRSHKLHTSIFVQVCASMQARLRASSAVLHRVSMLHPVWPVTTTTATTATQTRLSTRSRALMLQQPVPSIAGQRCACCTWLLEGVGGTALCHSPQPLWLCSTVRAEVATDTSCECCRHRCACSCMASHGARHPRFARTERQQPALIALTAHTHTHTQLPPQNHVLRRYPVFQVYAFTSDLKLSPPTTSAAQHTPRWYCGEAMRGAT